MNLISLFKNYHLSLNLDFKRRNVYMIDILLFKNFSKKNYKITSVKFNKTIIILKEILKLNLVKQEKFMS